MAAGGCRIDSRRFGDELGRGYRKEEEVVGRLGHEETEREEMWLADLAPPRTGGRWI